MIRKPRSLTLNARAGCLCLLSVLVLACGLFHDGSMNSYVIEPELLPLLDAPDTSASLVTVVRKGTTVRKIEDKTFAETIRLGRNNYGRHWSLVATKEGKEGWVPAVTLQCVAERGGYRIIADGNALQFYSSEHNRCATHRLPGTSADAIATLDVRLAGSVLIIFAYPIDRPVASFVGVFDRTNCRMQGQLPPCTAYLGKSSDGEHLAFDHGTGATGRELIVYSLQKKRVVHRSRPHRIHDREREEGVWIADGAIEFDVEVHGREPDHLPYLTAPCRYVRIMRWEKGRVRKTDRYETVCGE